MSTREQEQFEVLASIAETLIECISELARIIARETGNTEAIEAVTAKLNAFTLPYQFRKYLDESGDGD